jgi:hypothetical protein
MSLLLGLAAVLSTLFLLANLALGWGASQGWVSAPPHINFSFVAAISVLFSQAMLLFYLVGSARRVRQAARENNLASELVVGLPPALSVLPVSSLALLTVMGAFVLGGGAHTGTIAPWVHGWVALLSVFLQGWSTWQELVALGCLEQTIGKVEEALPRA